MNITLTVRQSDVYEDVKRTTSYTGAKMDGDSGEAYKRIFTTNADIDIACSRFWRESESEATQLFKPFLSSLSRLQDGDVVYSVTLSMPSNFDPNLRESMETALSSFFVERITAGWFRYCNRTDVAQYDESALSALNDVREKLYYRRKPQRPQYD